MIPFLQKLERRCCGHGRLGALASTLAVGSIDWTKVPFYGGEPRNPVSMQCPSRELFRVVLL